MALSCWGAWFSEGRYPVSWYPPQSKGRPPENLTVTFNDLTNTTATVPWFPDRNFSIRATRLQTSHQLRKEKVGDLGHVEPGKDLAPEPWAPQTQSRGHSGHHGSRQRLLLWGWCCCVGLLTRAPLAGKMHSGNFSAVPIGCLTSVWTVMPPRHVMALSR